MAGRWPRCFEPQARKMCMSPASTELLLRVNGIQPAFGIEFGLDSPARQRRPSGRSLPTGQRLVLARPAAGRAGCPAHADRLRHGRRAIAVGVRAHPRRPRRPRGTAHPSALRPFRPTRLVVDVPAAERSVRPTPAAADLRQPRVLGATAPTAFIATWPSGATSARFSRASPSCWGTSPSRPSP